MRAGMGFGPKNVWFQSSIPHCLTFVFSFAPLLNVSLSFGFKYKTIWLDQNKVWIATPSCFGNAQSSLTDLWHSNTPALERLAQQQGQWFQISFPMDQGNKAGLPSSNVCLFLISEKTNKQTIWMDRWMDEQMMDMHLQVFSIFKREPRKLSTVVVIPRKEKSSWHKGENGHYLLL